MKVGILAEYYPPKIMGGAEVSISNLVEILTDKEMGLYVLTPNYEKFKDSIEKKRNLKIYRFKSIRYFFHRNKKPGEVLYKKSRGLFDFLINQYTKFSAKSLANAFSKVNEKEKFDIVHANNIESTMALSYIKDNVKKIAHLRDLRLIRKERVKRIQNFDRYIAMSNLVKKRFSRIIKADKIEVVPNPILKSQIASVSKEEARKRLGLNYRNIVLFAGALTYFKGADKIAELAKHVPEADFIVAGEGPLKHLFNKNIKNVHYLGEINKTEIKYYYRAADIFLNLTKLNIGYGRVIAEAQLNKAVVVAFDIEGIDEMVIHEKTGLVAKDSKEMIDIIRMLFRDKNLAERIRDEALERTKKIFDEKNIAKKIISVYKSCLKQ